MTDLSVILKNVMNENCKCPFGSTNLKKRKIERETLEREHQTGYKEWLLGYERCEPVIDQT